ncbi:Phenylalanine--tRNA ligase alpha subunit [Buchnera aphidicola (Cinara piceae)]|uniref:Phenylalanine--tRNA ligase alpha subunit n=1 Tax=Buchnera aphidicola (Cinara piceae) TaxID=1660043 RepID=A0A803GCP0_9GAMM|nr:phenylalanine--tRNA ligase subunit alpha [Buchnera aphidicola]VFP87985.1 Phenylalanine--tRNA ligase alpha subunit [Buchnera aphidicola (Cinara piceae)]
MKIKKEIYLSLKKIFTSAEREIQEVNNITELNNFQSKYLGKNSIISFYFNKLIQLNISERKECSIILNDFKKNIKNKINNKKIKLQKSIWKNKKNKSFFDVSLPGRKFERGSLHPITMIINKIKNIFNHLGFLTYYGPELENIYYNFDSLNIPKHHPSRSINDTFWFNSNHILRTQTSSMQVRILEKYSYPIRAIFPGKVYRRDYDHTHTPMFHQIEGLIVDKAISFANLKWILENFIFQILKKNVKVRFRSSYFPFTCPSAEMDIQDKNGNWLEILGCGMVHPNVLKNCNINHNIYSACAFGIGIERIAMLKYSVSDIRCFFENDIRFLKQFV